MMMMKSIRSAVKNFLYVLIISTFVCSCSKGHDFRPPIREITGEELAGKWRASEQSMKTLRKGSLRNLMPEFLPTLDIEESGSFRTRGFPVVTGMNRKGFSQGENIAGSGQWDTMRLSNGTCVLTLVFQEAPSSTKGNHIGIEIVESDSLLVIRYWIDDPDLHEILEFHRVGSPGISDEIASSGTEE